MAFFANAVALKMLLERIAVLVGRRSVVKFLGLPGVWLLGLACGAPAFALVMTATGVVARPKSDDQCLSQAEVRELVSQKAVTAPGPVLRKARAAAGPGAKVLRAVLCRRDGQYVYRVTLLMRDGKVVHQAVVARPARSDPPR